MLEGNRSQVEYRQDDLSSLSPNLAGEFIKWWDYECMEYNDCGGHPKYDERPEMFYASLRVLGHNFFCTYEGSDPVNDFAKSLSDEQWFLYRDYARSIYVNWMHHQVLLDKQPLLDQSQPNPLQPEQVP